MYGFGWKSLSYHIADMKIHCDLIPVCYYQTLSKVDIYRMLPTVFVYMHVCDDMQKYLILTKHIK